MTPAIIAMIVHETNRAYCESLGDHSQKPWFEAPEWAKKTAIAGVNFKIENPNATPKDMHYSWLYQKLSEGWRYGRVKDVDKKEHPCMVEYHKLPRFQQIKDELFEAIVSTLAREV